MDDHRATENFVNSKAVGEKGREGTPTVVAEKGREVACVVGVGTAVGVVVPESIGKFVGICTAACASRVNVKTEDRAFARVVGDGQPRDLGDYENAVARAVKADVSPNMRVVATAVEYRHSLRPLMNESGQIGDGVFSIHKCSFTSQNFIIIYMHDPTAIDICAAG